MMTEPLTDAERDYMAADQSDRMFALDKAADLAVAGALGRHDDWLGAASEAYRWLRRRDSLQAAEVHIVPGVPRPEGQPEVATVISLNDTDEVGFTLTGTDAKGASVPLESGYTAVWTLADPDGSGATVTPSADGTSCTVDAGTPSDNVSLSVVVTNPDGSTLTGVEAIQVVATAATAVSLVAGTPSAEPAPAPPSA